MGALALWVLSLLALSLTSCTINPLSYERSGNNVKFVSLGGSVLTKSAESSGRSTELEFSRKGSDEASAAVSMARTWGMTSAANAVTAGNTATQKAAEVTARKGIDADVSKTGIAADVEKTRIAADVEKTLAAPAQ